MKLALALLGLAFASTAFAHDVTRSDSKIEVQGREVRVALTLNIKELQAGGNTDLQHIYEIVRQHYFVRAPGDPEEVKLEGSEAIGGPLLQLRVLYTFPNDVSMLTVRSTLYEAM